MNLLINRRPARAPSAAARTVRALRLLPFALAAAACVDVTDPPETAVYEGTFTATPAAEIPLSGTAALVTNLHSTEAGVFLSGPVGTVLSWTIRSGRCDGSGQRISGTVAFPPLTLTASGDGNSITTLNWRLDVGTYSAEVFAGPDASGAAIACADLNRTG